MRSRWLDLYRRIEAAADEDERRQLAARAVQDYQKGHGRTLLYVLDDGTATPALRLWVIRWLFGFIPMPGQLIHLPFNAVISRERTPHGAMRFIASALKELEEAGEHGDDGLIAWFYELCEQRGIAV